MEAIRAMGAPRVRPRVEDRGDAQFAVFYSATWPDVVAFCSGMVGDTAAGEEIAQDAFVRVYPRFARLDDARPYVFRVAGNLCRRHRAHAQRVLATGLQASDDRGRATSPDATNRIVVAAALSQLVYRVRQVVLLHYYADMSVREIAGVLGRPEGTVKRQLHDGRRGLAAMLGNDAAKENGDGSR